MMKKWVGLCQKINWHTLSPFVMGGDYNEYIQHFSPMNDKDFMTVNGKGYSHNDINLVREFFTDEQWDVIDSALSEFQDHDESYEIVHETLDVMGQVFRGAF